MKMHFRQLLKPMRCGEAPAREIPNVPSWVPPPWQIPLIDKDEKSRRKQPVKDERPRVEIQIDGGVSPEGVIPVHKDEGGRGVVVIDRKS